MKYYLIVGEASGDLHASRLMRSIQKYDANAEFRYFGGDNMFSVGGIRVRHYKELAYMGFIPVLLHLRTILRNMKVCKTDIIKWQPDALILVDYPDFNLQIAKYIRKQLSTLNRNVPLALRREVRGEAPSTKIFYYISPKIWAWKEWRIRSIKRDIDELFSILPFEVDFFEKKHHYPIHYVGNPTVEEVNTFLSTLDPNVPLALRRGVRGEAPSTKIIALLAGSRKQEIKDNLPAMIEAAKRFEDYELVLAGAPAIEDSFYQKFIEGTRVRLVKNQTYELLSQATAALVTSGTATLETALFNVPQVVCYKTPLPKLMRFGFNHFLKVKYISLVNLIANREVVTELFADRFKVYNIANELYQILPGQPGREEMLSGYADVRQRLGNDIAPDNAARIMLQLLKKNHDV
ncbi:MAG: lipid-A-disaccharide synthase [Prevotella sp.]|nr:lipid-A-disaccharide synthase [Prevotella sp.]